MGRGLDDALQDMAQRCSDPFVSAMVIALVVGRRTGGNVATTLRRIAFSTREAVRVELELNSKTRGQRNQFYLVVLLYPLGLLGMKLMMSEAWSQLIHSYSGKVALFVSMSVVGAAVIWAQRILNPDNL
jgi:Flp pilus assembly protein TadB